MLMYFLIVVMHGNGSTSLVRRKAYVAGLRMFRRRHNRSQSSVYRLYVFEVHFAADMHSSNRRSCAGGKLRPFNFLVTSSSCSCANSFLEACNCPNRSLFLLASRACDLWSA